MMQLRAATADDFAFIRRLAGHADNAPYITDDDDATLAAHLANPAHHLLIWDDAGQPAGFALFCDVAEPSQAVELRRLALVRTGKGEGAAFLAAMVDYAFEHLAAQRLWLDASGENIRAQRAYIKAGFTEEGRLRQHWFRPALGRVVDLVIYGMLRDEWRAQGM